VSLAAIVMIFLYLVVVVTAVALLRLNGTKAWQAWLVAGFFPITITAVVLGVVVYAFATTAFAAATGRWPEWDK
jgi:hypothetical protein